MSWFEVESGKITGFDYNLFAQAQITGNEYLAILKSSFDLRLKGNRAPIAFETLSDMYSDSSEFPNSTPKERREAVEGFLDYVLEFEDVRVVSARDMLDWIRNSKPL